MKADYTKVLGGKDPVEADETFIGTKARDLKSVVVTVIKTLSFSW